MFEFFASHLHILFALLSALAIGTVTYTNEWFTADEESWSMASISTDTGAVLTFKNTNYLLSPEVILVPTDGTFYLHNPFVAGVTNIAATITQVTVAGAGNCRIIVRRRR